jgi:hypothetical protein
MYMQISPFVKERKFGVGTLRSREMEVGGFESTVPAV